MNLLNTYKRYPIQLVKGKGSWLIDQNNQKYLDLYGGHGVISIGHQNTTWLNAVQQQMSQLSFYSNVVHFDIQEKAAMRLKEISGYQNHQVFFCNSGTEANEHALKLAQDFTMRSTIVSFKGSFHGRSHASLSCTDLPHLHNPSHQSAATIQCELNDFDQIESVLVTKKVAAVIIEGIQGVGGLDAPTITFLQYLSQLCDENGTILILDEVQSGCGRTGKYFAHQHAGITPDIITMAKGIGNGFPVGAILVNPFFNVQPGQLGSTFGGNPLACAAVCAVVEELQNNNWMKQVEDKTAFLGAELLLIEDIKNVTGKGLMIGFETDYPSHIVLKELLDNGVFAGSSSKPNQIRILPSLSISHQEIEMFIKALKKSINIIKSKSYEAVC